MINELFRHYIIQRHNQSLSTGSPPDDLPQSQLTACVHDLKMQNDKQYVASPHISEHYTHAACTCFWYDQHPKMKFNAL